MKSQTQTWYGAGSDIAARAAFSLAMCGALAGLLFATAQSSPKELATSSASGTGQPAKILASLADPGLAKSQAVVDASPAAAPVVANIPVPTERVAAAAMPARRVAAAVRNVTRPKDAGSLEAVRFESCLPGCDTQDPLIVGQHAKAPAREVSPGPSDQLVEEVDFAGPRPSIVGMAFHAPQAVYRKGRTALTALIQAAL